MTDTEPTTEPTPTPQGDIEALAGERQYPCPEPGCDRVFPSPNALQGHKIAHMTPANCPECGKQYRTPGALGNHRKHEHGVETPLTAKQQKTQKRNGRSVGRPRKIAFDWEVDDIVDAVLREMFPTGNMPIEILPPLLQWRDATRGFLNRAEALL